MSSHNPFERKGGGEGRGYKRKRWSPERWKHVLDPGFPELSIIVNSKSCKLLQGRYELYASNFYQNECKVTIQLLI